MTDTTYATINDLREQYGSIDSKFDGFIQRALNAAAELVDELGNWDVPIEAPATPTVRLYAGSGEATLRIHPCVSITTLEMKTSPSNTTWVTVSSSDYLGFQGDPLYPDFNALPYRGLMMMLGGTYPVFTSGKYSLFGANATLDRTAALGRGLPTVRITGRFGFASVLPARAKQAVLTQASRWVSRGQMKWADSTVSGDMGQLQFRKVLDPDVQAMMFEGSLVKPTTG